MPSQYLDVRFGSLADLWTDSSLMSAFEGRYPPIDHQAQIAQKSLISPLSQASYNWSKGVISTSSDKQTKIVSETQ